MSHNQKVVYFEQMLRDRHYRISTAIPLLWRLLWRLGFKTPPPHFLPFLPNVILAGLPFGGVLGIMMWFPFWRNEGRSNTEILIFVIITGLIFGLLTATPWRIESERLQLPDWSSFPLHED
jgi:Family of unknown function (DUF6404)